MADKPEYRSTEIIQPKSGKCLNKNKTKSPRLQDNMKHSNIHITGIPDKEKSIKIWRTNHQNLPKFGRKLDSESSTKPQKENENKSLLEKSQLNCKKKLKRKTWKHSEKMPFYVKNNKLIKLTSHQRLWKPEDTEQYIQFLKEKGITNCSTTG